MAQIGFIGLGNMGLPMAANLAKAGHRVIGCDLMAENRAKAEARGITVTEDGGAAAQGADVVITMLPAGKNTRAVYGSGMLDRMAPGGVAVDCSTIDVASARAAHEMAAKSQRLSLDCPVSGGVGGAEAARRRSTRQKRCWGRSQSASSIAARLAAGRPRKSATT